MAAHLLDDTPELALLPGSIAALSKQDAQVIVSFRMVWVAPQGLAELALRTGSIAAL